jgi:hypothetical protein
MREPKVGQMQRTGSTRRRFRTGSTMTGSGSLMFSSSGSRLLAAEDARRLLLMAINDIKQNCAWI